MRKISTRLRILQGFTLIELLVVIAVIGVLAGAIIVAVNPVEQLARGRDAARKSSMQQLANAVSAYYASKGGTYPTESTAWITALQTSGELKSAPSAITAAGYTACTNAVQNGFCYDLQATTPPDFMVYTKLESTADTSKCASGQTPYFLFSSYQAKTGVVCTAGTDPTWSTTFTFF